MARQSSRPKSVAADIGMSSTKSLAMIPPRSSFHVVEHVKTTISTLGAFYNIRKSCKNLQMEMNWIHKCMKSLSKTWRQIFHKRSMKRFCMARIHSRLAAIAQYLDLLLFNCTNSKRNFKTRRWPRVMERIKYICVQARVTLKMLQCLGAKHQISGPRAIRMSMLKSILPNITKQLSFRNSAPTYKRGANLGNISGFVQRTLAVKDANTLPGTPTRCMEKTGPGPSLDRFQSKLRKTSQEHQGLQQRPPTTWLRSLLGFWAGNVLALSGLHKPALIPTTNSEFESQFYLSAWLVFGTLSLRGSYSSLSGLGLSVRSSKILELRSVARWVQDPQTYTYGLEYSPYDHIDTGCLLLEWMIYERHFEAIRLLGRIWLIRGLLSRNQLPRQVGHAINRTLAENDTLEFGQIQLLQHLKSFLEVSELDKKENEVHDAVVQCEDHDHVLRQALLRRPRKIDEVDHTGKAPIHLAIQFNRIKALKCLIEKGADINLRDSRNCTPLQVAAIYQRLECLQIILHTAGCIVDLPNDQSKTALQLAAEEGSAKAVVMLISAGASAVRKSRGGSTALHLLSKAGISHSGAKEILYMLQSKKADVNARDEDGNTPLLVALRFNNLPVLKALLDARASLTLTNDDSQNMLHFAALHAEVDMLGYLAGLRLEGVDTGLRDDFGRTPKGAFRWTMRAHVSALAPQMRRPSLDVQTAFSRLFFGILYRNFQSNLQRELHTLHLRLQAAKLWESASAHIQSELSDTAITLGDTQTILNRFIDPFSRVIYEHDKLGGDPERESGWETCASDDDQDVFKDAPLESEEQSTHDSWGHGGIEKAYKYYQKNESLVGMMDSSFTLPELVDVAFRKLLPIFEPAVPDGKTRVRWKCICGDDLFDDFTETRPDSLDVLRARLSASSSTQDTGQQERRSKFQMLLGWWAAVGSCIIHCMIRLVGIHGQVSRNIPLRTAVVRNRRHGRSPRGEEVLHLLLCIDKGQTLTRLHQERLQDISGDEQLFSFLREQYFKHRKFTSWFTLRGVESVSLARFRVDANCSAGVHSHGVACSSQCICLPPVARLETGEYCCAPAPQNELGYSPALGPRELLHYFQKAHDFKTPQRIYLNQIPKRACGQLRASQDEAELGWGLHFEEGWHWRTIYFLALVLVAIGGIAFGIIWSVTKGDIQSAFSISAAWIALGPLMLGFMAIRDV